MDRSALALVSPEVVAFVSEARRYCDFIERAGEHSLRERLAGARVRVLALYAAAIALPHVEPPEGVDAGPCPKRPQRWRGFDAFETYWEVFDPYELDAPVAGSLSDDLLGVYGDVLPGLVLWDQDVPRTAALWEWRFGFDRHWGAHAIDALRALHRACDRA